MKLSIICETTSIRPGDFEELIWNHKLASELPLSLFHDFREYMLNNIGKTKIDRQEPITPHEVKVGGARDGKRRCITEITLPRSVIAATGYEGHTTGDELWQFLELAVSSGYASPDPIENCGDSFSIFRNVSRMNNNSVTFQMACWLPDFTYLDQLEANNQPKYSNQS